jgi:hypothetical protein
MSAIFYSVNLGLQVEGMDNSVLVHSSFVSDYAYALIEHPAGLESWYHVGIKDKEGMYEQDDLPRLVNYSISLQHPNYDAFTILTALLRDWHTTQSLVIYDPRLEVLLMADEFSNKTHNLSDRPQSIKAALWSYLAYCRFTFMLSKGSF